MLLILNFLLHKKNKNKIFFINGRRKKKLHKGLNDLNGVTQNGLVFLNIYFSTNCLINFIDSEFVENNKILKFSKRLLPIDTFKFPDKSIEYVTACSYLYVEFPSLDKTKYSFINFPFGVIKNLYKKTNYHAMIGYFSIDNYNIDDTFQPFRENFTDILNENEKKKWVLEFSILLKQDYDKYTSAHFIASKEKNNFDRYAYRE